MPSANNLRLGEQAMIVRFTDEKIEGKLTSMGMMPGSTLQLVRKAPFGGGFYVKIDGVNIAMRTYEIQQIVVG
jgi:ferrous iron transport protein A